MNGLLFLLLLLMLAKALLATGEDMGWEWWDWQWWVMWSVAMALVGGGILLLFPGR